MRFGTCAAVAVVVGLRLLLPIVILRHVGFSLSSLSFFFLTGGPGGGYFLMGSGGVEAPEVNVGWPRDGRNESTACVRKLSEVKYQIH